MKCQKTNMQLPLDGLAEAEPPKPSAKQPGVTVSSEEGRELKKKICTACKIEKPIEDFHKHITCPNRRGSCKACAIKRGSKWRKNNMQRVREWKQRFYSTERGKKSRIDGTYRYIAKYPEKKKALTMLNNAVRDGRIKKQPCLVCGEPIVQAHHEDYSKPLSVVWLCDQHHKELHRARRNKG